MTLAEGSAIFIFIMASKQNTDIFKKIWEARKGNMIVPATQANNADINEWVRVLLKDIMESPMEDEAPKVNVKPILKALAKQNDKNPYVRARETLFSKSNILRNDIEKMEKEGRTNCRIYLDFVEQVKTLGDRLSDTTTNNKK